MSTQTWSQCITAPTAGTAITNTTSLLSLLPSTAIYTFPVNFFSYIGQKFRLRASGVITTSAAGPVLNIITALTIGIEGAILFNSQISTVASLNSVAWDYECNFTLRSFGSQSGGLPTNFWYDTRFSSYAVSGSPAIGAGGCFTNYSTTLLSSSNIDLSQPVVLDLKAAWGTANTSSIQLVDYCLEATN